MNDKQTSQTTCIPVCILLWIFSCGTAFSATLTAQVDRNPAAENESVTYTLVVENPGREEPDWTPLEKDFEILNRSSSTNMQVINGSTSYSRRYRLSLMPRTTGLLQIPPIQVGKDRSNGIDLIVTLATSPQDKANKDLFLEVEATPENPYIHSQVLLTVKLFIALPLSQGALSEPSLDDVVIERLGEDNQYTTTRGSRQYRVIERRYALFPEKPGVMTVPSLRFEGTLGSRDSFFDPFSRRGPTKRIQSPPQTLTVRPEPENAPQPWLAAKKLQSSLEWSEPLDKIQAGTPVTATIRLKAQNCLAKFLPEPQLQSDDSLRTYSDQPQWEDTTDSQGLTGTVEKKITFIAPEAGTFVIAPWTITYWNTEKDEPDTVTIDGANLHVLPVPGTEEASPPPLAAGGVQSEEETPPTAQAVQSRSWKEQQHWFWISCFLAVGWAATGCAMLLRKKKTSVQPPEEQIRGDHGNLGKQLQQACRQGDAEAVRRLLGSAPRSLKTSQENTTQEQAAYLQQKTLLDKYLYSQSLPAEPWDGTALYDAWVALHKASRCKQQRTDEQIAQLYD